MGVEEELILTDTEDHRMRPMAREVVAACRPASADGAEVKHEFYLSQVEVATRPHTDLAAIRGELAAARARIADAGKHWGVAPLAVPGPVLALSPTGTEISPEDRYAAIEEHYEQVARESLMCALHVHVEVADAEEGVAVIDRVRPWIPVLLAMSANSPYWHGRATGYASWRSRVWNMWPTSGPAELFGNAEAYRTTVQGMVARGPALDEALVNLDVRLSHRYPTVEFRVADVCTDLDDAILIAALARGLVTHTAQRWQAGDPAAAWRVDELRGAAWRAARFGISDTLVSPTSRELAPAVSVVRELVDLLAGPLEVAGDSAAVESGLRALAAHGDGATRQRAVHEARGDLAAVVADVRERTLEG
jgi:glutamate---cysteine ligase / carboxylate-amine ligase